MVKGESQMNNCVNSFFFGNKSWTKGGSLKTFVHKIEIKEFLKFTIGQGHKVKDQGQMQDPFKMNHL